MSRRALARRCERRRTPRAGGSSRRPRRLLAAALAPLFAVPAVSFAAALASLFWVLFGVPAVSFAGPTTPTATLVSIETERVPAGVAAELILHGLFQAELLRLENPDRFVVDLRGAYLGEIGPERSVGSCPVERVRLSQFELEPEPVVRVVFDLTRPVDPRVSREPDGLSILFPLACEDAAPAASAEQRASRRDGASAPAAPAEGPAGWDSIAQPKTADERSLHETVYAPKSPSEDIPELIPVLPPRHQSFRLQAGLGHVAGIDSGLDLTGRGPIGRYELDAALVSSLGEDEQKLRTGRLFLTEPALGRRFEAGDLHSTIWGRALGARYLWGTDSRKAPALSLYVDSSRGGNPETVLAVSRELRLSDTMSLVGEVATDGSLLMRGRHYGQRLNLDAFVRAVQPEDEGYGLFATYQLPRNLGLGLGYQMQQGPSGEREWLSLSLRIPIARRYAVTLEHTVQEQDTSRQNLDAIILTLPLRKMQFHLRYQLRANTIRPVSTPFPVPSFRTEQDELWATARFNPLPWASFDLQSVNRRFEDGRSESWEQMLASFRLRRDTSLQFVGGLPDPTEGDQMSVRLVHQVGPGLTVSAEYGNVSPYLGRGREAGERLVLLRVSKQWSLATPAAGGRIEGYVRDIAGRPMRSVGVEVGRYRAVTDAEGHYEVDHLEPGSYDVRLSTDAIPARYGRDESRHLVEIHGRRSESVDFVLTPLGGLQGWVYLDVNANGRRDPDEGVAGAVLLLGERATATGDDGSFGFFNMPPGDHVVELDVSRLPSRFELVSPARVDVPLTPDRPASGLEFRLRQKQRAILFQEPPAGFGGGG